MGETIFPWLVCPLRLPRTEVASGFRGRRPVCDGLTRTTLELKCTDWGMDFKKTFEERGRSAFYMMGKWSNWTTLVLISAAANGSASKNSTASANSRNTTEELQGIPWNGSTEKGWSSWLYLLGCN